ncbi:MAG: pyridoxal phosphate-dependent aminotransferase [Candidatus Asgardarchaeia archaeon]
MSEKKTKFSIIRELDSIARELQRQGKPVINLTMGQNELISPNLLLERIYNQLQGKPLKYETTEGSPEARDAVIEFYNSFYKIDLGVHNKNVILTDGAFGALRDIILSIFREGDIFLIDRFSFRYPAKIFEILNLKVRIFEIKSSPETFFIPSVDEVNEMVQDLKKKYPTKRIIYYTHWGFNPTGVCRKERGLKNLVSLVDDEKNLYLLNDIVYHLIKHNDFGVPFASYFSSEGLRIFDIDSLSKPLGMMGFRGGLILSRDEGYLQKAKLIQQFTIVCPNTFSVVAWYEFSKNFKDYMPIINELNDTLYENKLLVDEKLRKIGCKSLSKPEIGLYSFIDCTPFAPASELSISLLKKANVAVVPGTAFTSESDKIGEKYIRLVVSFPKDLIDEATTRILNVLGD